MRMSSCSFVMTFLGRKYDLDFAMDWWLWDRWISNDWEMEGLIWKKKDIVSQRAGDMT